MNSMMTRGYNFGAGPAMLPESLLLEVQTELLNWQDLDMSVLEIGHRTEDFQRLIEEAESDLRELLSIPEHYQVLFLGGAARTQFAMIPMNLLAPGHQGAYLISGAWSRMAYDEACKVGQAYCAASSESQGFTNYPDEPWPIHENTSYVYYTPNETIHGVRFAQPPNVYETPLIADMTSCLLTEPINVTDFALIFAGAQKNIAAAGLTIVILRDDLLEYVPQRSLPTMLDYRSHAAYHSLYATPPVFNCYLASKMFKWIKAQGGVNELYQLNCQKAAKLYQYIDTSSFYHCRVQERARSLVNVCFSLNRKELELEFVRRARQHDLYALQGHRTLGGIRASLYNAMPMAGVDALLEFMQGFAREHQ